MNRTNPALDKDTDFYTPQEIENRRSVVAFYTHLGSTRDLDAAISYLSDDYREHAAEIDGGFDAFRAHFLQWWAAHPDFRAEVRRVFVEGNIVAIHGQTYNGATTNGEATVDVFRMENGRIVEHWNTSRPIPDDAAIPRSML